MLHQTAVNNGPKALMGISKTDNTRMMVTLRNGTSINFVTSNNQVVKGCPNRLQMPLQPISEEAEYYAEFKKLRDDLDADPTNNTLINKANKARVDRDLNGHFMLPTSVRALPATLRMSSCQELTLKSVDGLKGNDNLVQG
jgi:hypothetical protein